MKHRSRGPLPWMAHSENFEDHPKENTVNYPISEIFTSPQGEGMHAGQMQTFIRLAGCTVGKPYQHGGFPMWQEKCTLYDGRTFPCDTNYRLKEKLTPEEIIERIPDGVDDVCITGGEPLMHDISTLLTYLIGIGRRVHIETSGTIYKELAPYIWVTVSPKQNVLAQMIDRANEIKILVDKRFDAHKIIELKPSGGVDIEMLAHTKPVYLQPVNFENEINPENLQLCMEAQRRCPALRISVQMHKAISNIIMEHVR